MSQIKEVSTKEMWKDVPGFDGMYQISNSGRVRSWRNNRWGRAKRPKILQSHTLKNGYDAVSLGRGNKMYIHRIMATAFIPNPENKPQVNHIDGNKVNNRISNLEWVTQKENSIHASNNGLLPVGEDRYNSVLTNTDVIKIKALLKQGRLTHREIAKKFGITRRHVGCIKEGRSWSSIKTETQHITL